MDLQVSQSKKTAKENAPHLEINADASFVIKGLNYFCFLFFLALNRAKHLIFGVKKTYSFDEHYDYTFDKIQHSDGGYQTHIASRLREIYNSEFGEDKILHCFLFPKIYHSNNLITDDKDNHLTKKLKYD